MKYLTLIAEKIIYFLYIGLSKLIDFVEQAIEKNRRRER